MTDDTQPIRVENSLLRACLFLTVCALKEYQEAAHFEIDDEGRPMVEVIVSESLDFFGNSNTWLFLGFPVIDS